VFVNKRSKFDLKPELTIFFSRTNKSYYSTAH